MMKNIKESIKAIIDSTYSSNPRIDCPSCGGRNTLSLSHTNQGILFNCFKVQCNIKGFIPTKLSLDAVKEWRKSNGDTTTNNPPVSLERISKDFSRVLPTDAVKWLSKRNVTSSYDYNLFQWDEREWRIVVPLKDVDGNIVNYMGRAIWSTTTPKAKVYSRETEVPPFVYNAYVNAKKLIIVEDFCSAIAAVNNIKDIDSLALMGTNYKPELHNKYIDKLSPDVIYLALDRDAVRKATRILRYLRGYYPNVKLLYINKDIKDMDQMEFKELRERVVV